MKKISKLSPKTKRVLVITSAAVICVSAFSAILYHVNEANARAADTTSATVSSASTSASAPTVSVPSITGTTTVSTPSGIAGTGSAWTPSSGSKVSAPLTVTPKPESAPPKPIIKGDSKDGKQPTNSALTDKTTKPTYTTPPKAPEKSPASSTPATNNNGGSTKKQGSDPIFGDFGGSPKGQGTVVGNDGDTLTGDKVGIMD